MRCGAVLIVLGPPSACACLRYKGSFQYFSIGRKQTQQALLGYLDQVRPAAFSPLMHSRRHTRRRRRAGGRGGRDPCLGGGARAVGAGGDGRWDMGRRGRSGLSSEPNQ